MNRPLVLAAVVLLSACKPTNAELTAGSFQAFLSHNTSHTYLKGDADLMATETAYHVDCRTLSEGQVALDQPLPICDDPLWPPENETWMSRDAWHVQGEDLEPWRGEAVLTSEGDLQITFHHRVTGGDDMRFAFVVDPAFHPRACVEDEDGDGTRWEDVDGDWVASWSDPAFTTLGGGEGQTVVLLNASSYQFDPTELTDSWSLPNEWQAGFAAARYGEEDFVMRTTRYGEPSFYAAFEQDGVEPSRTDLFYADLDAGVDAATDPTFAAECQRVLEVAAAVEQEYALIGATFKPTVHCNGWRPTDGRAAGLDAWVELHYNWVTFDRPLADVAVGEPIAGEFHLLFDGEETQSRLLVSGSFEVDRVKDDRWVTDDIEQIKMEEHGTVVCGEVAGG